MGTTQPAAAPTTTSRRRFSRLMLGATGIAAGGAGLAGAWLWLRPAAEDKKVPTYGYEVVRSFPHDPGAFTQGLLFHEGHFYESTGQEGKSTLRKVEIATGKILQSVDLDADLFGEGLALVGDELHQLTWRNQAALVYDLATFKLKRKIKYAGEGWGLAYDGKQLILSDGTSQLHFIDAKRYRVERRIVVKIEGRRLEELNELEVVEGEIWANVWYQDGIARIDPKSGKVVGWIDLSGLWPRKDRPDDNAVLNGIAYDPTDKRIFVTGKNWPKIHEIKVVAK